jgi:serine/threonine-protein kinase
MGEVYLAEHKYIARRAAVKFLLPELTSSAEVVSRFFSEARAASLIEHPGIVEVLDCEVHTDGRAYIVMEFLNGESLRGYLDRAGTLDGDQRGGLAICRQMAGALAAAHAQGIVHRDLKPDNVFLHLPAGRAPEEPVVKLLDFGIAKLHGGPEGGSKTRTGQLLGTPLYMSPEQCRGARLVDSRSDIYSFGCIMFEMFCGRPPFVAEGFGDLIMAHISEAPPDPLGFSPGLGAPLCRLLLRCLEKSPDKRPATMTDVGVLLAEVGAPDALHLRVPVVRGRADGAGARSPAGFASPPAAASTPARASSPQAFAATATPASSPAPGPMPPPAGAAPRPPTIAPTTLGGGATEVGATVPSRSVRRKLALVAASLAAVAAIAVVVMRGRDAGVAPPPVAAAPRPAPMPAPAAAAEPAPEHTPPAPPALPAVPVTSAITLTGLPDGASVRLDGRPAPSPLTVPRGPQSHRLAVEAHGYEPWEQVIDGAADQTLAVHLKPSAPDATAGAIAPAKAKHKNERHRNPGHFNGFSDLY